MKLVKYSDDNLAFILSEDQTQEVVNLLAEAGMDIRHFKKMIENDFGEGQLLDLNNDMVKKFFVNKLKSKKEELEC